MLGRVHQRREAALLLGILLFHPGALPPLAEGRAGADENGHDRRVAVGAREHQRAPALAVQVVGSK